MPADGDLMEQLDAELTRAKEQVREFRNALAEFSPIIEKIAPNLRTQIEKMHKLLDERETLLDKILTVGRKHKAAVQDWMNKQERS